MSCLLLVLLLVHVEPGQIRAKSGRSLLKNRRPAEIGIELEPLDGGALAATRVDMLGNKHYALLSEIVENAGDDLFDDRGITDAVSRRGKMGRLFGRKECATSITFCTAANG